MKIFKNIFSKNKEKDTKCEIEINELYKRIISYKEKCEVYDAIDIETKKTFIKNVREKLGVSVPNDYVILLEKSNGIFFGNGINILNDKDMVKYTNVFKDEMEEWEISKIKENFLVVAKYHDGEGYVFWYSKLKKYVVVDYLVDCELDDVNTLNLMDSLCEVIEYLEKEFKEYFNL